MTSLYSKISGNWAWLLIKQLLIKMTLVYPVTVFSVMVFRRSYWEKLHLSLVLVVHAMDPRVVGGGAMLVVEVVTSLGWGSRLRRGRVEMAIGVYHPGVRTGWPTSGSEVVGRHFSSTLSSAISGWQSELQVTSSIAKPGCNKIIFWFNETFRIFSIWLKKILGCFSSITKQSQKYLEMSC